MNDFKYMQWDGKNEGEIRKYFEKEIIVHSTGHLEILVNRTDGIRGFIAKEDDFIIEVGVIEKDFIILNEKEFLFFQKVLAEKESQIKKLKSLRETDLKVIDLLEKQRKEQDPCPYCNLEISLNGALKSGELLYCSDLISVGIHKNSREVMLVETDCVESFIKIRYCPMCGDYLGGKE